MQQKGLRLQLPGGPLALFLAAHSFVRGSVTLGRLVFFEPQFLAGSRQLRLQEGRAGKSPVLGQLPDVTLPSVLLLQWERLWFLLLVCTFSLTLTWLYFWWEVHNDYDEFNW